MLVIINKLLIVSDQVLMSAIVLSPFVRFLLLFWFSLAGFPVLFNFLLNFLLYDHSFWHSRSFRKRIELHLDQFNFTIWQFYFDQFIFW